MKKILLLLITTSFLIATSCEKEADKVDAALEEQHRLVRCKVNGEDWRPRGDGTGGIFVSSNPPFDLQYYSDNGSFGLRASNGEINQGIKISGRNTTIGENEIFYNGNLTYFSDGMNTESCIKYDSLNNNSKNTFTILTLDTVNFIMTGEFEYEAINDCEDTVKITGGYFDLYYRF